MSKASVTKPIVLDRDGVINEDLWGYVTRKEEFKPIKGSLEAIEKLTTAGFAVVVATNQACISKKIINEKTLSYCPNGAVIINSARGDMIDDEDMVNALKSRKIFALGLDVYNGEPDIHPQYLKLDNVFILPHLGSATEKTRFAMADLAINNIEEYFKTGKCKNTVN